MDADGVRRKLPSESRRLDEMRAGEEDRIK